MLSTSDCKVHQKARTQPLDKSTPLVSVKTSDWTSPLAFSPVISTSFSQVAPVTSPADKSSIHTNELLAQYSQKVHKR
jgi:hypothetical protein